MGTKKFAVAVATATVLVGGATTSLLSTPATATTTSATPSAVRAEAFSQDIAAARTPVAAIDTKLTLTAALNGSAVSSARKAQASAAAAAAAKSAADKAAAQKAAAQKAAADKAAADKAAAAAAASQASTAATAATAKAAVATTAASTSTSSSTGGGVDLRRATMWDQIASCESTNNWSINTGNGFYGGLQFQVATWQSYGGSVFAPRPDLASRAQQITIANRVYDNAGGASRDWECARILGIS